MQSEIFKPMSASVDVVRSALGFIPREPVTTYCKLHSVYTFDGIGSASFPAKIISAMAAQSPHDLMCNRLEVFRLHFLLPERR